VTPAAATAAFRVQVPHGGAQLFNTQTTPGPAAQVVTPAARARAARATPNQVHFNTTGTPGGAAPTTNGPGHHHNDNDEPFDDIHQAFEARLTEFHDKEKSYGSNLLDVTVDLTTAHSMLLESQFLAADLLDSLDDMHLSADVNIDSTVNEIESPDDDPALA
jgi:hypothetical protein